MDWINADFERAKLIEGLNVACLKENFDMILAPIRNIQRTLRELRGKGIKCILITAGPIRSTDRLRELGLLFDYKSTEPKG